jgi:hypothetical protein
MASPLVDSQDGRVLSRRLCEGIEKHGGLRHGECRTGSQHEAIRWFRRTLRNIGSPSLEPPTGLAANVQV